MHERRDVGVQCGRRTVRVAVEGESQDLAVFAGLPFPGGRGGPGDGGDEGGLVADLVEHPAEQRVAARQVQRAVELPVGEGAFGGVGGLVGAGQRVACGVEGGLASYGTAERLGFEEQPYVVHLARHVRVHHAHRDALVLVHHDEPGTGQGLERLAHRGLGHPELCGEVGLDQWLTRRQLPGEDAAFDLLLHVLRAGRDRRGHRGHARLSDVTWLRSRI